MPPRPYNGKKFVPKATGYSAQTISDFTTPQGIAQANEEFRRIQNDRNNNTVPAEQASAAVSAPGSSALPSTSQPAKQRLTVKHNDVPVINLVVESIDFQDTNTVAFDVVQTETREVEVKARTNESALYKATQVGQILYSKDGSTFHRELPLTSLVSGVILNDDGIIMII